MKIHKAKKSLGQNFLKSASALREIIKAGEISPEDTILEIGPGLGTLTEKLLETGAKVIAVEKDRELFAFLQEKFAQAITGRTLVLVHEDILNLDASTYGLTPKAYKIIANIPYNITGAILKKFLSGEHQPERMVLMVQNEVAKRIVGSPRHGGASKKESILSISVKAYGTPKIIMKVPARYFSPAPKVDSAVIAITNISRKILKENNIDEEKFFTILRAGFAHKRKKLSSNLKSLCQRDTLTSLALGNKRAEELNLKDWLELTKILS